MASRKRSRSDFESSIVHNNANNAHYVDHESASCTSSRRRLSDYQKLENDAFVLYKSENLTACLARMIPLIYLDDAKDNSVILYQYELQSMHVSNAEEFDNSDIRKDKKIQELAKKAYK